MQMVMQSGNPSETYLRGWWANGGTGYGWQKIWTNGNDGAGSGLVADYATKVTFNTQGNTNTTLKLLLGDPSNSTIAAGTVYKDASLSFNCSSNTLYTGTLNTADIYIAGGSGSLRQVGPSIQGTAQETRIANGDGETVILGLNSAGKVVGAEYESSITMTKAQFASLGASNDTYMVQGRAGYLVVPLESMFIMKCSSAILSSHVVPSVIQVRQENCSGGFGTVSQITNTQIRAAGNAAGTTIIQRDIPLTQRDYKEGVNTYFRFGGQAWSSAAPFVSITIMIKYRLIKSSDYN